MEKLANISQFESLMNSGSAQGTNTIFNKVYPEPSHPFREGFKNGWDSIPWLISLTNPLAPLFSLIVKLGGGSVNGLIHKLRHSSYLRKHAKELEEAIQGLLAAGYKPEAKESYDELKGDFDSKRMNRDQYFQLLRDLFYENDIYRSSDYDDPYDPGEEPYKYTGPTFADYWSNKEGSPDAEENKEDKKLLSGKALGLLRAD